MLLRIRLFLIRLLLGKEVEIMAAVYATLIVKGLRTFDSVPALVQNQVKEILVALVLEELAQRLRPSTKYGCGGSRL